MIERAHPKLSVGAQCRLLSISRSSFYYAPQGETAMNLDLMLLIDKQFLDTPFWPGGPERAYLDILKNFCRTDQAPGALRYMATFSAVNL